jgi:hypothetical protein
LLTFFLIGKKESKNIFTIAFFKKAIFMVLVSSAFPKFEPLDFKPDEARAVGFLWVIFLFFLLFHFAVGFYLLYNPVLFQFLLLALTKGTRMCPLRVNC